MRKLITGLLIILTVLSPAAAGTSYKEWTYTGKDIPEAGNEKFIFNLWICDNGTPGQEVEIVLSNFSFNGSDIKTDMPAYSRAFNWSGFQWSVRENGTGGPGDNYWSDSEDNVWVENESLHMRITCRNGTWYCPELSTVDSLGYGNYSFTVESDLNALPDCVVLGGFTYLDDDNEIDIEFSRWNVEGNKRNSQYAVQPSGRKNNHLSFMTEAIYPTTHSLDWQPERIIFSSSYDNWPATGISSDQTVSAAEDKILRVFAWCTVLIIAAGIVYLVWKHRKNRK